MSSITNASDRRRETPEKTLSPWRIHVPGKLTGVCATTALGMIVLALAEACWPAADRASNVSLAATGRWSPLGFLHHALGYEWAVALPLIVGLLFALASIWSGLSRRRQHWDDTH